MAGTLSMTGEVREWLASLCASDPPLARRTVQAILALVEHGTRLGPPLAVPVPGYSTDRTGPGPDRGAALDNAYQRLLEGLTGVRRSVADVATSHKRIELQLSEIPDVTATEALRAGLRAREAELARAEQKLTAESQRLQQWVEGFRMRKEVVKARYTAAQAQCTLNEAAAMFGDEDPLAEVPFPGADEALGAASAEITRMLSTAQAFGGTLRPAKARRKDTHPAADPETLVAPPDLMSMRPAAPGRLNLRILFTFGTEDAPEPAARGSVLLLAAAASHAGPLGEPDPLITQALGRYWLAVTGDQAPGTGPASYDRASFASEFFPGEAAALAEEAAALVARTRPYGLAALRNRSGLTQAQVAERLGVRQERVSALERGDLSAAEVRTLAAYVTALGGRLDITAEFGTDNLPLA